jgi:hypothetical protein
MSWSNIDAIQHANTRIVWREPSGHGNHTGELGRSVPSNGAGRGDGSFVLQKQHIESTASVFAIHSTGR